MRLDSDDPCPPGEHKIAFDSRVGMSRCTRCGQSSQSLTTNPRTAVEGDYRVVCRGVEGSGACSIGPSEVIPEALPRLATERYSEHQRAAVERDGEPHDAEVIQFEA